MAEIISQFYTPLPIRFDQLPFASDLLDLLPQMTDVDHDGVAPALVVLFAPYRTEELLRADDLSRFSQSTHRMENSSGVRAIGFSLMTHSWVARLMTRPWKSIISSLWEAPSLYRVARRSWAFTRATSSRD